MLWRCCRHLFWRHVPVLFCVVTWLTKPGHQKPLPMTSPQRSRMVDADIMISATIIGFPFHHYLFMAQGLQFCCNTILWHTFRAKFKMLWINIFQHYCLLSIP